MRHNKLQNLVLLTTQFITSPQEQKTNNFHQIDLDANGVLTHGRK